MTTIIVYELTKIGTKYQQVGIIDSQLSFLLLQRVCTSRWSITELIFNQINTDIVCTFYYINQGNSWNMSFSLLPLDQDDIINGLPSLTRFNNTLLLIQTIKNVPNYSLTCLEAQQHQQIPEEQDSLAILINTPQKLTIQTSDIKRKKTGCTCRKTNCLKNYCQCFSLGKQCTPQCACYGCYNTHEHAQLVKQTKAQIKCKGSRKTSPGCICKKSQCQKKYCECFNAGVACTQACKCIDCQNHVPHSHNSEDNEDGKIKKQIQVSINEIERDRQLLHQNFSQSFCELNV